MKKVLITGANGFIAKNLCAHLQNEPDIALLRYTRENEGKLTEMVSACDFVFHLAAICRHPDKDTLVRENLGFTSRLLSIMQGQNRRIPILFTSSVQALMNTPYGICKREEEKRILAYENNTGSPVYFMRLPGVFGKDSRPDYNSVVATFCYRIAHALPIRVENPEAPLTLCYIDDVVDRMTRILKEGSKERLSQVEPCYSLTVGELAEHIRYFERVRTNTVPALTDPFLKKLYSTYVSFLPQEKLLYPLKAHRDERGLFAEFLHSDMCGQISINRALPGVTKGGHVHRLKYEKFLVVSGSGVVRLRKQGESEILSFPVDGEHPQVVEIPPGYVHDIVNTGKDVLVFVIWANENFDSKNPDTYREGIKE